MAKKKVSKSKQKQTKPKTKTVTTTRTGGRVKKTTVVEGESFQTPILGGIVGGISGIGIGLGSTALDGMFLTARQQYTVDVLKPSILVPVGSGAIGLLISLISKNSAVKIGSAVFGLSSLGMGLFNLWQQGQTLKARKQVDRVRAKQNSARFKPQPGRQQPIRGKLSNDLDWENYTTPQKIAREYRNRLGLQSPNANHTIAWA